MREYIVGSWGDVQLGVYNLCQIGLAKVKAWKSILFTEGSTQVEKIRALVWYNDHTKCNTGLTTNQQCTLAIISQIWSDYKTSP